MERNFSNENLEEFLRQSADSLRMRPAPKVWKAISGHLNRRRWKMGLFLGTSLLLTTALGYYLVNQPTHDLNSTTHAVVPPAVKEDITTKPASNTSGQTNDRSIALQTETRAAVGANVSAGSTVLNADLPSLSAAISDVATGDNFTPAVVDSYFGNPRAERRTSAAREAVINEPLTIESVVNTYRPQAKARLGWQIYFTPTVSYRKLNDANIDNVATHKPAFGFEVGTAAKYPVSKNLKLRAGLQFNVNRYEIKTFDSYAQMATIRLDNGNRVDYVNTVTNYNNFSGYKSNWLKNFYFQVSAPVGVELKLKGDEKVQFGVASTIQPTYLLGDRAYLISSDYKNYAQMPNLVRHWNVNTNLETFVSYSTGHLNWQVGPQVRYQLLSSYLKKYPVKENLFDFGLKVGISLNNQQ